MDERGGNQEVWGRRIHVGWAKYRQKDGGKKGGGFTPATCRMRRAAPLQPARVIHRSRVGHGRESEGGADRADSHLRLAVCPQKRRRSVN
jgi:hypothetical protein